MVTGWLPTCFRCSIPGSGGRSEKVTAGIIQTDVPLLEKVSPVTGFSASLNAVE